MKRATPIPFILLVVLALAALFAPVSKTAVPTGGPINPGDVAWMLTASALVLLMTPGLSFFYGGMVSLKNVVLTMLQSVVALGVISLVWLTVGFSLAFGDSLGGVVGNPLTFLMFDGVGEATHPELAKTIPLILFAFFQLKFAIITPALITGSFAERVRFSSYLLFIVLFSLFIYAPLAHWTWHPDGFLHKWGVLDFAGGTVVHMSAGWAALAGGADPRPSEEPSFQRNDVAGECPVRALGHGDALVRLVRLQRWLGAGRQRFGGDGLRDHEHGLGGGDARLDVLRLDARRKPSALGACIGAVVGLVAITPAAGYVTIRESIFIGLFASVVSNMAAHWKSKLTLDDTLDVFPCHGVGGMVGMLLTGVFATGEGLTSLKTGTFLAHLGALVIVSVFSFGGSWILYKVTDLIIPMRVSEEQEIEGLDLSQHGETAIAPELLLAPSTNGNGVHAPLSQELVLS